MNISLIGMMGSGKTTIGELLTKTLTEYSLIDTDSEIIKSEACSINTIFEEKGEEYFRKKESHLLKNILENDNQIISTGGGIINNPKNIELLKEKSIVFYLKASPEEIYKRVKNNKERPLLNVVDINNKINKILSERACKYELAHFTINTDGKKPAMVVSEILGKLDSYGTN